MKQGDLFGDEERAPVKTRPSAKPPGPGAGPRDGPAESPTDGSPGGPPDSPARSTAVTEFRRPILLSAGAGTGKTATLVARVLHWCLGVGWEAAATPELDSDATALAVLRGVSAITFTEAAAAEMSTRTAGALAAVERIAGRAAAEGRLDSQSLPAGMLADCLPACPDELGRRAQALRAALDHLQISTIHAFCRRLLATYPLAVGLDPGFEVDATFAQVTSVAREMLERYLEQAWGNPVDPDLVALAAAGHGPPEIEVALIELVESGARALDFTQDPLTPELCEQLLDQARASLAALMETAPLLFAIKGNTELACDALRRSTADLGKHTENRELSARERLERYCASLQEAWRDAGDRPWNRLKDWGRPKFNKGEIGALGEELELFGQRALAARHALEPLRALDTALLDRTRRVIGQLLTQTEAELRRRGVATFADLLVEAGRLLVENPELAARERRRMTQLLVDEFQDTDSLQCDIVRRLALDGPLDERPGLFVVGDPKQSIFAWRNADLRAFDEFTQELCDQGGIQLELSTNFRSRAAILAEVERSVSPIMQHKYGVQPEFRPLDAGRDDAPDGAAAPRTEVEYWVSWPQEESPEGQQQVAPDSSLPRSASYEIEARAIAADLLEKRAAGASWDSFALVFRALTQLEPYLQALRENDIPYQVQSDRKYYRRREIVDATALVRAVLDPHDQIALLTLLRSPFVGMPDAALVPLWERKFPQLLARLTRPDEAKLAELDALVDETAARLDQQVAAHVPGLAALGGWSASVRRAVRALAAARRSFAEDPVDEFVDKLRSEFHPDVTESARFLGAYRLANLERFFRELLVALEQTGSDARSVLRKLSSDVQRANRSEASRPADSEQEAVSVLTIHGAKGLEFDHVYLLQTHKGEGSGDSQVRFDRRGTHVAYKLFGTQSPSWPEAERMANEAAAAERVRLYYVALTRAAERLVIVGVPPEQAKSWSHYSVTFADFVASREHAPEARSKLLASAASGDQQAHVDPTGAVWRLAADVARGKPRLLGAESPAQDAPTSAETRPANSLASIHESTRAAARLHRARPWQRVASAESHAAESEALAERRFADPSGRPAFGRDAAQAIGTAIHALLEELTFTEDAAPLEAWSALCATLPERLREHVPSRELEPALERARDLAQRTADGFLERLAGLRDQIVARELPVLSTPVESRRPGPGDPKAQPAPVALHAGSIDLVYRDPTSGQLVVVDYKTDRADTDAEVEALTERYAPQGRVYVDALREALQLDQPPRFELWFLHAGRVTAPHV